jgi:hypothetical protein
MRVLLALLLTAGVLLANGPPPPVKGKKWVKVELEVQVDKEVKGYLLYEEGYRLDFKGPPVFPFRKFDLDDKKPTPIPSEVTRRYTRLYAVPESVAKGYKTDKELEEAISKKQVKGVHSTELAGLTTIDQNSKSESVTRTYTITGIDEKDGIKLEIKGEGHEKPADKKDEKKPLALAEPGSLVGGVAVALAVTFGGLWLIRRRKR